LKRSTYDTADHHRHKPDTAGALCVNCHMPGQTYMGIDFRRDHSFRVPRPDLTVEIATPNACSDCHAEKGADWAAEQVKVWFPEGRNGRAHFGKIFAKARRQLDEALVRQLIGLALDEKTSGIVRATALELLRSAPSPAVAAETTELLNADDVLVRTAAIALQRGAPAQIRAVRLAPLLSNPYRVIRIEAARALLDVPRALYPPKHVAAVGAAMREYQLSLVAKADFPETQLVIAGTALALRNLPAADSALKTALSMDPQIGDAWLMLARLQLAQRKVDLALQTLEQGVRQAPEAGPLYHALGNVLMQQGKNHQALPRLQEAAKLMAENVAVQIDLAVALTRLNKHMMASEALERARDLAPNSPDILSLQATNYLKRGRVNDARETVKELTRRHPRYRLSRQLRTLMELGR
jgi:Flp pilus assembly protein TadD